MVLNAIELAVILKALEALEAQHAKEPNRGIKEKFIEAKVLLPLRKSLSLELIDKLGLDSAVSNKMKKMDPRDISTSRSFYLTLICIAHIRFEYEGGLSDEEIAHVERLRDIVIRRRCEEEGCPDRDAFETECGA